MRVAMVVAGVLLLIVLLGWVGLKIKPSAFPAYPFSRSTLETMPLPAGLPAPVERYYRTIYGAEIPIITSAVISGRATMRPVGVTLPARFRFTHVAGRDYRHYIEATLFGLPVMRVNESYLDGVGRMELPWTTVNDDPKNNQAANLGLWGESIWLPAIFLTDPRVRWEPLDDTSAILVVPFESTEERFIVRFDPATGLPTLLEAMRYRDGNDGRKILWINEILEWAEIDGVLAPRVAAVTWFDQGSAWAVFTVEELVFNADVTEYVRARGL